jgi:hypothetical protein
MTGKAYTDSFERFWKSYPRKVAKPAAFKVWDKNIEGDAFLPQQIIADVEKRKRWHWFSKDKTKIPHPATWLNQRRWEDEDWQEEIKQEKPSTPHAMPSPVDTGPKRTRWEIMGNRILFAYIHVARGLPDEVLQTAVDIKNRIVKQNSDALDEEIGQGTAQREVALLFANVLLDNLDLTLGFRHKSRVMQGAK